MGDEKKQLADDADRKFVRYKMQARRIAWEETNKAIRELRERQDLKPDEQEYLIAAEHKLYYMLEEMYALLFYLEGLEFEGTLQDFKEDFKKSALQTLPEGSCDGLAQTNSDGVEDSSDNEEDMSERGSPSATL